MLIYITVRNLFYTLLFLSIIKCEKEDKYVYIFTSCGEIAANNQIDLNKYIPLFMEFKCFISVLVKYIETIEKYFQCSDFKLNSESNAIRFEDCNIAVKEVFDEMINNFISYLPKSERKKKYKKEWIKLDKRRSGIIKAETRHLNKTLLDKIECCMVVTLDLYVKFLISAIEDNMELREFANFSYFCNYDSFVKEVHEYQHIIYDSTKDNEAKYLDTFRDLISVNDRLYYINLNSIFLCFIRDHAIYDNKIKYSKITAIDSDKVIEEMLSFLKHFQASLLSFNVKAKLNNIQKSEINIDFDATRLRLFSKLWLSLDEKVHLKISSLIDQTSNIIQKLIFENINSYLPCFSSKSFKDSLINTFFEGEYFDSRLDMFSVYIRDLQEDVLKDFLIFLKNVFGTMFVTKIYAKKHLFLSYIYDFRKEIEDKMQANFSNLKQQLPEGKHSTLTINGLSCYLFNKINYFYFLDDFLKNFEKPKNYERHTKPIKIEYEKIEKNMEQKLSVSRRPMKIKIKKKYPKKCDMITKSTTQTNKLLHEKEVIGDEKTNVKSIDTNDKIKTEKKCEEAANTETHDAELDAIYENSTSESNILDDKQRKFLHKLITDAFGY